MKIFCRSAVSEVPRPGRLAPKLLWIYFLPHSDGYFELQQVIFTMVLRNGHVIGHL